MRHHGKSNLFYLIKVTQSEPVICKILIQYDFFLRATSRRRRGWQSKDMDFDVHTPSKFAIYAALAETVAAVLGRAVIATETWWLHQVQQNAKKPRCSA
jgi:hypothetical protein